MVAALYTRPTETSPVKSVPRPTVPLLFAILLTAAATLILGIVPGRILANARGGCGFGNDNYLPAAAAANPPAKAPRRRAGNRPSLIRYLAGFRAPHLSLPQVPRRTRLMVAFSAFLSRLCLQNGRI